MLSEFESKDVWKGWLSAEIRANYFADLSFRYQRAQRIVIWLILACSSGAFATVIADWLPDRLQWVRPALAAATAALSLWSLVAQHQTNAMEAADLHFQWNRLAIEYQSLWANMYSEDAAKGLQITKEKAAELSKRGTAFPNRRRLMLKWEDHVVRQHATA